MSAGLPGAGLAGLFFILSAILAVPIELFRTARGRSSRKAWIHVARHAGLALAMIVALELGFAALSAAASEASGGRGHSRMLPLAPVVLTLAVLVAVLAATKTLELALRWRRSRAEATGAQEPHTATPHRNCLAKRTGLLGAPRRRWGGHHDRLLRARPSRLRRIGHRPRATQRQRVCLDQRPLARGRARAPPHPSRSRLPLPRAPPCGAATLGSPPHRTPSLQRPRRAGNHPPVALGAAETRQ